MRIIEKKILIFLFLSFLFSAVFAADKNTEQKSGAKDVVALADEDAMVTALDMCYLDINYYVSLENLNDLLNGSPVKYYDNIDELGGTPVIDLATGMFKPTLVNLTTGMNSWKGPYITYQPNNITENGLGYDKGTPIDPWGRPYYFYSPVGLISPSTRTITLDMYGDTFDRYAIVSLGSDGIKSGDDIITLFGGAPVRNVISSTNKTSAAIGDLIVVNGYNFGTGTKRNLNTTKYVMIGSKKMDEIFSWEERTITFRIAPDTVSGNLTVFNGTETSNPIPITITQEQLRNASQWELYE